MIFEKNHPAFFIKVGEAIFLVTYTIYSIIVIDTITFTSYFSVPIFAKLQTAFYINDILSSFSILDKTFSIPFYIKQVICFKVPQHKFIKIQDAYYFNYDFYI
jgi:hypothetical protein